MWQNLPKLIFQHSATSKLKFWSWFGHNIFKMNYAQKLEKIPSKGQKDHTKFLQDTARQFHSSTALSSNLIKIAILNGIRNKNIFMNLS